MSNQSENTHGVSKFLRQNGYYLLLMLCIAAVGLSCWYFVSTAKHSAAENLLKNESSANVPVIPVTPPDETEQDTDAAPQKDPSAPSEQETPEPDEDAEAANLNAIASIKVRPVNGQSIYAYSIEQLNYNPTMRDWRTHDGIDLACEDGTPVRAAMGGTVCAVYDDDFLGTVVEIEHKDGYRSLYANLSEMPTVSVGEFVSAGQIIGAVGATALGESSENTHLHFAVYVDGKSMDPEAFLQ